MKVHVMGVLWVFFFFSFYSKCFKGKGPCVFSVFSPKDAGGLQSHTYGGGGNGATRHSVAWGAPSPAGPSSKPVVRFWQH